MQYIEEKQLTKLDIKCEIQRVVKDHQSLHSRSIRLPCLLFESLYIKFTVHRVQGTMYIWSQHAIIRLVMPHHCS